MRMSLLKFKLSKTKKYLQYLRAHANFNLNIHIEKSPGTAVVKADTINEYFS